MFLERIIYNLSIAAVNYQIDRLVLSAAVVIILRHADKVELYANVTTLLGRPPNIAGET